jgi:hypothetical protein
MMPDLRSFVGFGETRALRRVLRRHPVLSSPAAVVRVNGDRRVCAWFSFFLDQREKKEKKKKKESLT